MATIQKLQLPRRRVLRHKSIEDLLLETPAFDSKSSSNEDGVQCLFEMMSSGRETAPPIVVQEFVERLFGAIVEDPLSELVDSVTRRNRRKQPSPNDTSTGRLGTTAGHCFLTESTRRASFEAEACLEAAVLAVAAREDVHRRAAGLDDPLGVVDAEGFRVLLELLREAFKAYLAETQGVIRLHEFDDATLQELQVRFQSKSNRHGLVDTAGLVGLIKGAISEPELLELIEKLNVDRSGFFSLEEFLGLACAVKAKGEGDTDGVNQVLRSQYMLQVTRIRGLNLRAKLAVDASTLNFLRNLNDPEEKEEGGVVQEKLVEASVRRAEDAMHALGGGSIRGVAEHMRCRAEAELDARLLEAAEAGDTVQLRLLARIGANVNCCRNESPKETPLILALTAKQSEAGLTLLALGADPTICDDLGISPLLCAVTSSGLSKQHDLLALLARPEVADKHGDLNKITPLIAAATRSNAPLVKWLLDHDCEPSLGDAIHGRTPLMHAAAAGSLACCRVLVDTDADLNAMDDSLRTARDHSKKNDVTDFLRSNGAVLGADVLRLENANYSPGSIRKLLGRRKIGLLDKPGKIGLLDKSASLSEVLSSGPKFLRKRLSSMGSMVLSPKSTSRLDILPSNSFSDS